MATPTYAQVLTQINTYIVANGNNEITANVLNPILQFMLDFANNNIGDLSTLTTDEQNSIVEAINSLKENFNELTNNGVQLHTGINNPNITPPSTYNYADFYMQVDPDDQAPLFLWQFNGFNWTNETSVPDSFFFDFPLLTSAGIQEFEIPSNKTVKQVFINRSPQFPLTDNNFGDLETFTQEGTTLILNYPTEINNYICGYYQ